MKKMIYVVLIIIAVVILAFVLIDGSFLPRKYNNPNKGDVYDSDMYNIINYAIGAPSGHNMQPWLIKIVDDNTAALYADMSKTLSVVDADNSQMLMGQGAFIQKFEQGAELYSYSADVKYAEIDLSNELPLIAELHIEKMNDTEVDVISASSMDAGKTDEESDIEQVIEAVMSDYTGFVWEYIDNEDEMNELQELLLEGTAIESKDTAAMEELLNIFRFTDWEKNEYRYGLSLNSLPSITKPFLQPIVKLSAKNIKSFGESSISMYEDRLKKDVGYILIKKVNPESMDYVQVGEIYQSLISNASGFRLRPSMQVLEKFDAMKELNAEFQSIYGKDSEVLIIINVQQSNGAKSVFNPRHMVDDILVNK